MAGVDGSYFIYCYLLYSMDEQRSYDRNDANGSGTSAIPSMLYVYLPNK